jgi:hypothetical protein
MFSVFQCEASGRVDFHCPEDIFWSPDGRSLVVWTGSGYVWTRVTTNDWTVRINHLDARDLSAWFRGSARPDDINSPSGRGPHKSYIYPWVPYTPPYPSKISLFGILCIILNAFLDLYCFLLSFCTLLSFQVFSNLFLFLSLFSLVIFKLLDFFWNVFEIMRCIYLLCWA